MSITAGYSEIATTVAQLKAVPAANRCPNLCLFVPSIEGWVYYNPTSTATANDTTIFAPNDGIGRWIFTNQPTAPSGGSSGITQQPGLEPAQATLSDLQRAVNQILSTLTAAGITQPSGFTRNYDLGNPTNDLINLLGTNNGSAAFTNPHPAKITNTAISALAGAVSDFTNRANSDFNTDLNSNAWVQVDFGSSRTVRLTGVGLKSRSLNTSHMPLRIIIEGSNDNITFTQIFDWTNIGFTATNQDKFTPFTQSPSYRYIRLRQPVANSSGANYLTVGEIYFYGNINAL